MEVKLYKEVKLYNVYSDLGFESCNNIKALILGYAYKYSWEPREVQKITEMEIGDFIAIENLRIERIR